MSRARNWVFTLNSPVFPADNPRIWATNAKYCIWQLEAGSEGTVHVQGYLVYSTVKSLAQLKRLNPRIHWEVRAGTHAQAKAYCTKEESRSAVGEEWGDEPPGSGHRSDLDTIRDLIQVGTSDVSIADEHFGNWCRYHRSFSLYRSLRTPPREHITFTTVYWGVPGVGKTKLVAESVSSSVYWLPKPNGTRVFWDGYTGQDDVVIDEFFGWMARDLMCRICDRYPFRVETKGGSINFVAKRIFITSNNCPKDWWPRVGLGPMSRRLQGEHGACYKMTENCVLSAVGVGVVEEACLHVD